MLVKFFKTAVRSPTGMTDYLLGKDRNRELSKFIKEDPEIFNQIAEHSDCQSPHTAGCLSFEERNIPLKDKLEIMDKFEETLLCGLEPEQYAIAWIEHKDKGRLKLNFHIANVELTTGKKLQPYYDRIHQPKINEFKKVINHDYGLSSPDDPSRKQAVNQSQAFIKRDVKDIKKEINEIVLQGVEKGVIKSRDDIKELLINNEFEITRETDKSISIKNPINEKGRNIRLSGGIRKDFYDVDRRNQKEDGISFRGTEEEIESIRKRLDSRKEREAERNKQAYQLRNDVINRNNSYIYYHRRCELVPIKSNQIKSNQEELSRAGVYFQEFTEGIENLKRVASE